MTAWIQTIDSKAFYPQAPKAEDIRPEAAAWALSNLCRFGGHTKVFYSVAEHSLRVWAYLISIGASEEIQKAGLLHDVHEAFSGFGDVCNPIKQLVPFIKDIECRIDAAVAERFGIEYATLHSPEVRHADLVLLATEKRDLLNESPQAWVELPEPLEAKIYHEDLPFRCNRDAIQDLFAIAALKVEAGTYRSPNTQELDMLMRILAPTPTAEDLARRPAGCA